MRDIYFAMALMAAVSAGSLFAGLVLGRRLGPKVFAAVALLVCTAVVLLAAFVTDHLLVARLLPFSNVIVLGDWIPPVVALLAGLAWRRIPGRPWRRGLLVSALLLLCGFRSYGRLFAHPPPLEEKSKRGVCLQTSQASCSAAAAATLLKAHGVETGEAEMARLCLTRPAGTPMHGLYRGLKLKAAGAGLDVQAFRGDMESLRRETGPVILSVRLEPDRRVDERYERLLGWTPGVSHTVVLFGFREDGKADIGDPAVGREQWRLEDLSILWHGEGIRLTRE
jgi:hypothetical protein